MEGHWIIFGGGFNPPHLGHLEKAAAVITKLPGMSVAFMPTYKNSWDKPLIDFYHRLNMLKSSIGELSRNDIVVSNFEGLHQITGSTIDVLEHWKQHHPENVWGNFYKRMHYLIGHDQADLMDKWNRWEELIKLIPFIVVSRRGYEENKLKWYRKKPHLFLKVPTEHDGISSTEIREQLKKDRFSPYLTPSTLEYVRRNNLYV